MSRTPSRSRVDAPSAHRRAVSRPHDAAERQADRAADVVARGGTVSGWSLGSVPLEAGVHREEKGAPAKDEDKLKDAAKKVGEAALETDTGKRLQEKVKEDPLVKGVTKFVDSTAGKVVVGGAAAAGVGALAATKQPLPFQPPSIPLDKITPGLSAQVKVEGPVSSPTFVGLSLSYKEQGPKGKAGPTEKERIAADTARLRAEQDMLKPQAVKDQEKADEQAAIARVLALQSKRFGTSTLLPIGPAEKPKTVEGSPEAGQDKDPKKPEDAPVQREPVGTDHADTASEVADATHDTGRVDDAVRGGGRPLEGDVRRSMEARFGYDFGSVRIHDHAGAAGAAGDLAAKAFTVGEDIVFGSGGYDPRTPEGRHLLAHELAHVVQQRGRTGGGVERLQRRGIGEWLGILLGLSEGTWSDQELHAYLDAITAKNRFDGAYDADNKARAIVRRWKASSPGYDLLGRQKSLLIDEMLDGATFDDDEQCILDLLERSDASDLREIFAKPKQRMADLDSALDGDEHDRLMAFVASRFKGGRSELDAGRVEVLGPAVPANAPSYAFDPVTLEARLDSDRSVPELVELVDRFGVADRRLALDHLLKKVWPSSKSELGRARAAMSAEGITDDQKDAIYDATAKVRARVRNVERLLMHYFRTEVPATKDALVKATAPADQAQADALKEVLRPYQYAAEAAKEDAEIELDEPEEQPAPASDQKPAKAPAKEPAKQDKPAKAESTETPVKVERAKFHDPDKYRAEVEKELPGIIEDKYKRHVTDAGPRAQLDEIEAMALPAKQETDAVFGQFYNTSKKAQLKGDRPGKPGSLHFWYDTADRELKAMGSDFSQRRDLAISWVLYYFQSDSTIRNLNDKYNASPLFDKRDDPQNDEAKLLVKIANKITAGAAGKDIVKKLVETRRAWGGVAIGDQVFVDLYHDPDTTKDREACWEMFQTLVHEYLHTLAHKDYETYAKSFGTSSEQWNTLIEGVDCVLDEVVWAHVQPKATDPKLRKVVEGEAHAKLPPIELPYPSRYPSYEEAFRLVGLVGITNLYAAYFLGLTDRISVPTGKTAKPKAKGGKP